MYVIAIAAIVLIAGLLYLLDRALKAIKTGRRRRTAGERLLAATEYAEEKAQRRKAASEAGSALTSVLPAIQQPPEKGPRRVA